MSILSSVSPVSSPSMSLKSIARQYMRCMWCVSGSVILFEDFNTLLSRYVAPRGRAAFRNFSRSRCRRSSRRAAGDMRTKQHPGAPAVRIDRR